MKDFDFKEFVSYLDIIALYFATGDNLKGILTTIFIIMVITKTILEEMHRDKIRDIELNNEMIQAEKQRREWELNKELESIYNETARNNAEIEKVKAQIQLHNIREEYKRLTTHKPTNKK